MGQMLLTICLSTMNLTTGVVKSALEAISFADVKEWLVEVFGQSMLSKRKTLFSAKGLPKNKLFILKNNNHSRSVGGRDRWLPPPSNFVVELILYIINQVFLFKNIWN
jgi:hypothetical protein